MMAYLRWGVAAVGVGALLWLVAGSFRPSPSPTERAATTPTATPPPADACPADAEVAALDYTLKNADDASVTLSDFKGKVLLLDFWATWCGPCKVEIPHFIELQDRYGKDGFQVVGISVDDTPEKLKPFMAEMKMNYPVLQGLGHDKLLDEYGATIAVPVSVVISREGKVCARHMGLFDMTAFEQQLKALL